MKPADALADELVRVGVGEGDPMLSAGIGRSSFGGGMGRVGHGDSSYDECGGLWGEVTIVGRYVEWAGGTPPPLDGLGEQEYTNVLI